MLLCTDNSRVGFGVGCTESMVLMLMYSSLGLSSDEIHSVEMPLAVLLSLRALSIPDRVVDDRRVSAWSSGAGARCGILGGSVAANGGIKACGTCGDEGILWEGRKICLVSESNVLAVELVMGFRWSLGTSELRRSLSPLG